MCEPVGTEPVSIFTHPPLIFAATHPLPPALKDQNRLSPPASVKSRIPTGSKDGGRGGTGGGRGRKSLNSGKRIVKVASSLLLSPKPTDSESATEKSWGQGKSASKNVLSNKDPSFGTAVCHDCGKKFFNNSVLRRHTRTVHNGVRKYPCTHEECSYRAKTNTDLFLHLLRHQRNARIRGPYGRKCT